jgi:HEAT repeat protein
MKRLLGFVAALALFTAPVAKAADIDELVKQLKSSDNDARRAAAKALAEAGAEAKSAVDALTKALKDNDLFVRRFAAQALGQVGPDAKAAAPALAAVLKDNKEKKEVQEAAATALGKIGKPGVSALSAAVKDAKMELLVRKAAANALGEIGPDARDALPALTGTLVPKPVQGKKPPDPSDIRAELVTALGKIAKADDKEAVEALQTVADEKGRSNVKKLASDALKAVKERK